MNEKFYLYITFLLNWVVDDIMLYYLVTEFCFMNKIRIKKMILSCWKQITYIIIYSHEQSFFLWISCMHLNVSISSTSGLVCPFCQLTSYHTHSVDFSTFISSNLPTFFIFAFELRFKALWPPQFILGKILNYFCSKTLSFNGSGVWIRYFTVHARTLASTERHYY